MVFADEHVAEGSSTHWKQDRQTRRCLLCWGTASQRRSWVTRPQWHRPCQYFTGVYVLFVCNSVHLQCNLLFISLKSARSSAHLKCFFILRKVPVC